MKRIIRLTPLMLGWVILLTALSIALRFINLGEKPLMHDESLFAYYAYQYFTDGHYCHIPMLHGPVLMLASGRIFHWFGDSITTGRTMVGLIALLCPISMLALLPRRARWWVAPLILTSTPLLYYSRFFRDDMMFNGILTLGLLGLVRALAGKRGHWAWAILGMALIFSLLAVMENCLFFYASGVTFAGAWLVIRYFERTSRAADWREQLTARARPSQVAAVANDAQANGASRRQRRRAANRMKKAASTASVGAAAMGKPLTTALEPLLMPDPATLPSADALARTEAGEPDLLSWIAGILLKPIVSGPICAAVGLFALIIVYLTKPWGHCLGWSAYGGLLAVLLTGLVFSLLDRWAGTQTFWSWFFKARLEWVIGIMLGLTFSFYIYGITSVPNNFGPIHNLKETWDYWEGQHKEYRIAGPLHYYIPILITYELPLLLMLAAGLFWDALQRKTRLYAYGGTMVAWLLLWFFWRCICYQHLWDGLCYQNDDYIHFQSTPPHWMMGAMQFLHVEPNLPMLWLGVMVAPLLVWSVLSLIEQRVLAAWMGWWAACSLFQYSSAGEKVPWLAVHIALPFYLTLGWLWAPRLIHWRWNGRVLAGILVGAAMLIALRNDLYIINSRMADPRERLIYNHTTLDFDRLSKAWMDVWNANLKDMPLNQRRVYMVDDPGWPGYWYYRHCAAIPLVGVQKQVPANQADLIVGTKASMDPIALKHNQQDWIVRDMSLRDAWLAPWPEPDQTKWFTFAAWSKTFHGWWRYYWFRETWTDIGGFPITVMEPVKLRH